MSRFLSAAAAVTISAVSLYAAQKSYIAITNLQRYEERSERAAKHSETAARELYRTRVTQASSAGAIALSLVSSLALLFRTLFGSPPSPTSGFIMPPLNILAIAAAYVHNRGHWKAKGKVPFVGGINEGIEKSKEIRQLFTVLGGAWAAFGVLLWMGA